MANSQQQHSYEKKIQCLAQQVQEFHRQVEQVTEELDSTRCRLASTQREQDDLRRALSQRDETIICLEAKVENARFDLKEKETAFKRQNDCLQERVTSLCEQLHQKDSALIVCQNEVKNHLNNMEQLKNSFCYDLQQKDCLLIQMRESIQKVYNDLKCKSEDNCKLSREVLDLKSKLSQCSGDFGEAESKVAYFQEKIPQLENQYCKEKQLAVAEMDEMEKRLNQTHSELCCANGEIRKIKRIFEEKEEEMDQLCSEKESLCRDLQREREEGRSLCERVETLECDNKEICRLLQLKIKNLKEVEQTLCIREQELSQCRCCVDELNAKIREFNVSTGPVDGSVDNYDACLAALKKCEQEKQEMEKKLHYAVSEMEKLAKEVKRLKCELEELRNENCDKDMLIGDLKQTLEHAKHDMELRMCRVDQQLEKYEKEIKDKTTMLVEAEDKCCRFQGAVSNKNLEIEDLDQKMSNVSCEVESLRCQVHELQEAKQCLQLSINEERAHNAELAQENQKSRERLHITSNEIKNLKRDMCNCQRVMESHINEEDELRQIIQDNECTIQQLTEEKTYLSNKLASTQCRLEEDTNQLAHKLSETKNRLDGEIEKLRRRLCEVENSNSILGQKLSSKDRQISQMEKGCFQKVDAMNRETSLLQSKLEDKEFQLQATRDGMTIKDSEIMRLRLRLCSINRCSNSPEGDACKDTKVGTNSLTCLDGCGKRRSKSCEGRKSCCS